MWDFLSTEKKALNQAANHCRLAQAQSRYAYEQAEHVGKKAISSPVGLTVIFALGILKGLHSTKKTMPISSLLSIFQSITKP